VSWGERSCSNRKACDMATIEKCNVDCTLYRWDRETEPDSVSAKERAIDEEIPSAGCEFANNYPPPFGPGGTLKPQFSKHLGVYYHQKQQALERKAKANKKRAKMQKKSKKGNR